MLRDNSRSKADRRSRLAAPAGHRASDRGSRRSSGNFAGRTGDSRRSAAPLQEDG